MDEEDELREAFKDFSVIPPDPPKRRDTCTRCRRPSTVCWCVYLPKEPIAVKTKVVILQHPFEESRRLQTAPMLKYGLAEGFCTIIKGKRFSLKRHTDLQNLLKMPNVLLLFPSPNAVDLNTYVESERSGSLPAGPHTLILLDGTWMQARGIFYQNAFLQHLPQVKLSNTGLSEYTIRTQPTDGSLSTVETAAHAIERLEGRTDVVQPLMRPLRAMCEFQMNYGAVKHQSKQYLVENGLYKKQDNSRGVSGSKATPESENLSRDLLPTETDDVTTAEAGGS